MVTVYPKEGRGGNESEEEEDDTGGGGKTTTDACYYPSSSYTSSSGVAILVVISIGSDLGVVCTVNYPRDLVEILERYIEEEISYSGE